MSIGQDASLAVQTAWELVYRVSPVILTGGIASSLTSSISPSGLFGSTLSSIASVGIPIAMIIDPVSLLDPTSLNVDDLFAHFTPMTSGTLLDFTVAKQPYANQTVAGNAMVQNELVISVNMECAYRGSANMITRIAVIQAFQAVISKHVSMGGRFTVLTPGMTYTNALLVRITDVSDDPTKPQTSFQLDFERPLITKVEAAGASSTLMSKLTSGQQTAGSWVSASSGNPLAGLLGGIL